MRAPISYVLAVAALWVVASSHYFWGENTIFDNYPLYIFLLTVLVILTSLIWEFKVRSELEEEIKFKKEYLKDSSERFGIIQTLKWQLEGMRKIIFKETAFKVGQPVIKSKGYAFNGEVVSVFVTRAGQIRYVVELISVDTGPVLHIYSEEQLASKITQEQFPIPSDLEI